MFNLSDDLRCDLDYIIKMRRKLHMCPEIGFELYKTVEIVKNELDHFDIDYTTKYAKSSVVGYMGDLKSRYCIALRADMDALNITEENDIPYKSQNEGKMHACGHDAHTAILLGVIKALKEYEKVHPLFCKVKLIFQPSEEGMATGARPMTENGVMDDVNFIVGGHVSPLDDTGVIMLSEGPTYAANNVFTLDIKGKSAHASQPYLGVDAGWMASDLYMRIREYIASDEFTEEELRVLNIGMMNAGTAVNIVPGDAKLTCTLRTYSSALAKRIVDGIKKISDEVAEEYGGEITMTMIKELPPVINEGKPFEFVRQVAAEVFGEDALENRAPSMGSEDFAWYLTRRPGAYFNYGTNFPGNTDKHPVHTNKFNIDESAMVYAATLMAELVVKYDKLIKGDGELPA